jgi:hypothetical protein
MACAAQSAFGIEVRQPFKNQSKMIVHLVDGTYEFFRHFYRVKGFASRGLIRLV